ncbi:MAG: carboxypeptidase-like regulatory domain-containing protein [Cyanobacteria bacterium J06632_22]
MRAKLALPLALMALVATGSQALAHSVQTDYLLSNQLQLQTRFSNGQPLKGAKVSVYAPNNPTQPWMQGVTDANGRFAFEPDRTLVGDWEVTIMQQGHGDILTVPVDAEGIDATLISQQDQDTHYATGPAPWISAAVGIVLLLGAKLRQRVG